MDTLIRPMRSEDVAEAERLSGEAFRRVDEQNRVPGDPEARSRSIDAAAAWTVRTRHFLANDPAGCWVAENGGEMVGLAASYRRDLTWILATFAVRPGRQGTGIGRPLLQAALTHSRGCLRGMLAGSDDPRAFRLYREAGFAMHPQLQFRGVVDRSVLPVVERVRAGTPGDFALMDSIDRRLRDAAHGVDHPVLADLYRLAVIDQNTGSGYAYISADGSPALIAATNRRTATALLWEALASSAPGSEVSISHLTAVNDWAVDAALAARLTVRTTGFLALRAMKPPMPYLHHGSFL